MMLIFRSSMETLCAKVVMWRIKRCLMRTADVYLCFFCLYVLQLYFCFMCFGCGLWFDVISIGKQVCLSHTFPCLFDVISIAICLHVCYIFIRLSGFDVINIRKHLLVCPIFIHAYWQFVLVCMSLCNLFSCI